MKTKIQKAANGLLLGMSLIGLSVAGTAKAGIFNWAGTAGDNQIQNSNNWTPLTAGGPSASSPDTLQWNGVTTNDLMLTNSGGSTFDSNPGFFIILTSAQTNAVTIVESNGYTGRIRLNGTNALYVASGAGALTFGNGGSVGLALALAGTGNGAVHQFTNNSANPVTFNSDVNYVMGGGGSHTLLLAGTGNWNVNSTFQPANSAALGLTISGPGTVNLLGAATTGSGVTTPGSYGSLTLNAGTLNIQAAGAVGIGNTLVFTGGNLDSAVPDLVNSGNNAQSWNGNFGFIGTQNLDLGYGPVTMNASRIVTVNAHTLTVHGAIAGNGYSLTKAGAGTLALIGANTYTGGTVVSNGVLQLGQPATIPSGTTGAENVTVSGGMLDLNGSSILVSALNGAGNIDTISGGSVTLTVGDFDANGSFSGSIKNTAGSVALIKNGLGSLTLGGVNTYNGGTTVNAGTLLVTNAAGSGTGSGAVTVSSGATFGGSGVVAGSVTWQTGASAYFVQGSPLAVGGSVSINANTITVAIPGAYPLSPGVYPLMTYNTAGSTGSFPSGTPTFTGAGVAAGTSVSVTTGGGVVQLVVAAPPNLSATWTNNGNGNWSVPANWDSNPLIPQGSGQVANLGLGTVFTTVALDLPVTIGFVSFNNTNSYAIANAGNTLTLNNTNGGAALIVVNGSSNAIAAPVSLADTLAVSAFPGTRVAVSGNISSTSPSRILTLASGSGTLALSGNNTYGPSAGSVGTLFSGSGSSTLELGNNNALSAGDVSFMRNGTLSAATALSLANNVIISNTTTASVTDNGQNVTLSGLISGGGAFAKNGAGTVTLNSANTYNGDTSINGGIVRLGNASAIPGGSGNGNVNMGTNSTLDLNGFSPTLNSLNSSYASSTIDSLSGGAVTLTVGTSGNYGTYYGTIKNSAGSVALVMNGAAQQTLAGTNTYSGGTTITAGTLQIGSGNTNANAGVGTGPVVDNATLQFNLVGTNIFTNTISGSGAVNVANLGLSLNLAGNNSGFTGPINVNAGALWITNANALGVGPKTVTAAAGGVSQLTQIHLDGSRGNINVDSSITFVLTYLNGVLYNEAGSNTIAGNITMSYGGGVAYVISKAGFLTLSGTVSSDGTANGRTLQLGGPGNGLVSGSAIDNAQLLGGVTKVDAGTWTLSGFSSTTGTLNANAGKLALTGQWAGGPAVVNSGGTLVGSGLVSNLTVNVGGKFVPGDYGTVGTFTVSNILTMSGATYVSLNKSLSQPNSKVVVITTAATNAIATSGSTLIVSNLGPTLTVGDTFYLFNQAVTNGNLMAITAPANVVFTNNLAVDGSITVLSAVATNSVPITTKLSGSQLILSWPTDHTGWHVQAQTNSAAKGLGTNWVTVPGSDGANGLTNSISQTNAAVFYRLVYP